MYWARSQGKKERRVRQNLGLRCVLVVLVAGLGAAHAFAQCADDEVSVVQKLRAADKEQGDAFGISVSISGNTALVGAPGDCCAPGFSCGAAYVFRFDGDSWVEVQKLTASDAEARDSFGSSVSMDGDTAIVGAPGDDCTTDINNNCGSVYVFQFNGASWVEEQKLTAPSQGLFDFFGAAVSVSGDTALVGARQDDCTSDVNDNCGAAYLYRLTGAGWVEEQRLTASDAARGDFFGGSVSVSVETALVGASRNDCAAGLDCGAAYVFRLTGAGWVEEQKLTASDRASDAHFGSSVSLDSDGSSIARIGPSVPLDVQRALVGADWEDCTAGSRCGSAYVFHFNVPSWVQEQKLTAADADAYDNFGSSVSVLGSTAVVGAEGDDCDAAATCGSVYVYRLSGASWGEAGKLRDDDPRGRDLFGASVAVSGDKVMVGARGDDCTTDILDNCGSAYVFGCQPNCGNRRIDPPEECDDGGESATCDADCTLAACGDGTHNATAGEECDGGLGCTDCACDVGFQPAAPPSLDCSSACGNGSLDPGEECDDGGESATCDADCTMVECGDGTFNATAGEDCDGGLSCIGCSCDVGFESTRPPSVDCQPQCGNRLFDPGEECDGGLGCTDCSCDMGLESTSPPSINCRPTCGNGVVDPGEECDDDGESAACDADCTVALCGDGSLNVTASEECEGGLGCTACLCDEAFESTAPLSFDCRLISFPERAISITAIVASSVFAADVDGDGDTDVLSASSADDKIAWYENDGGLPPAFTERVISTSADGARSVFAADLDGDGDTDVLSASSADHKIAWYENDGGSPPNFTERVISGTAAGAFSVFATDIDGDGDIDVLSASFIDNKIAWYLNNGGSPPFFFERVIATDALDAQSVFAADVDGDGNTDVLSASRADDRIAWYPNDGGLPPSFTAQEISTDANFAVSVFAADVDGDGDIDVLSASSFDDKIAWYENDGGPVPTFTERVISTTAAGASAVFATDMDGDGDIDVFLAAAFDDKIAWYDNDGGSPPTFTEHVISTTAIAARSVFATDLDGDGDTDVLSASLSTIAWYENTTPPCGNGLLDAGQECDGGLGCTDCVCVVDFERTAPPSLDCQPICGNGSIDPDEECDGGFGCTGCLCNASLEPTTPRSLDCQPICGNGRVDAGEVCDGVADSACPGACLSDCSCDLFCGNGVCDPGEGLCNCRADCGTPPSNEVPGTTCGDGNDNDCDGLIDFDDPDCTDDLIPTVSQWGMILTALLFLATGKIVFRRTARGMPKA